MPTWGTKGALVAAFIVVVTWGLVSIDAFDLLYELTRRHEDWDLDEVIVGCVVALITGIVWFAIESNREHSRIRQEAVISRQLLEDAIENIQVSLVVYDQHDKFVICNDAHRNFYPEVAHLMKPGAVRKDIVKAYIQESSSYFVEGDHQHHVDAETFDVRPDFVRKLPDGRWVKVEEHRTREGGMIALRTDITPLMEHEQDLKRHLRDADDSRKLLEEQTNKLVEVAEEQAEMKIKAEVAERAKTEFLASMSHEIRTPMTGVMGFADLLLEDDLNQASKEKVYKIKDATQSLLRIINDILDVSKMEAGKLEFESIDFHLPSLIDDALALFEEKRKDRRSKNLTLEADLSDDFPIGTNADPTRLRQILINLIGNAVKFTENGGVTVKGSRCQSEDGREMLCIAVQDTGIGMKPEVIEKLFTEFTQADASITRRYEGSGLGLSICRRLVELMGGEIGVESEYGKGSTFWFTLPYTPSSTEVSAQLTAQAASIHYKAVRPLHILIVDDNALNQQIIFATITGLGHTSQIADNGMMAVEIYERGDFDLILMDIRMPVMSGPDATRLIRQMDQDKARVPIIALTADAMEEHKKGFFEAGMDEVVTKPIEIAELALAVNEVMDEEIHVPVAIQAPARGPQETEKDEAPDEETQAAVDDFLKQIGADSDD